MSNTVIMPKDLSGKDAQEMCHLIARDQKINGGHKRFIEPWAIKIVFAMAVKHLGKEIEENNHVEIIREALDSVCKTADDALFKVKVKDLGGEIEDSNDITSIVGYAIKVNDLEEEIDMLTQKNKILDGKLYECEIENKIINDRLSLYEKTDHLVTKDTNNFRARLGRIKTYVDDIAEILKDDE